jgi:inosine-uridine nucleoside N-ribohydrolase
MTKILIDCDPGHDDAVALLFAARHMDVVGISTVHGNSSLDNTTRNALALLELAGLDLPVARG